MDQDVLTFITREQFIIGPFQLFDVCFIIFNWLQAFDFDMTLFRQYVIWFYIII